MDIPRKIDKNNIYLVTYNLLDKYYNYNGEGSTCNMWFRNKYR